MAESALIVRVPQAESHVGALRGRFDPSLRRGVPAHITVLFPFMSPEQIDSTVLEKLREVLKPIAAFAFTLERLGHFPATTYLAPEPSQPFIELTRAIFHNFPDYPPNRGEFETVIPHLTVAHGHAGNAAIAAEELREIMRTQGPIQTRCNAVDLIENSAGRWCPMHEFALRAP